jgi:hypothetical protein
MLTCPANAFTVAIAVAKSGASPYTMSRRKLTEPLAKPSRRQCPRPCARFCEADRHNRPEPVVVSLRVGQHDLARECADIRRVVVFADHMRS